MIERVTLTSGRRGQTDRQTLSDVVNDRTSDVDVVREDRHAPPKKKKPDEEEEEEEDLNDANYDEVGPVNFMLIDNSL